MIYELAEQLKDEGFSQNGNGSWIGPPNNLVWRTGERVYVPTLDELIAACGADIQALTHERSHAADEWVASSFDSMASRARRARGAT
jgi:hypothetical protein